MGPKSSLWLRIGYVILGQMVEYPNPRLFHLESHFSDLLDKKLRPASYISSLCLPGVITVSGSVRLSQLVNLSHYLLAENLQALLILGYL